MDHLHLHPKKEPEIVIVRNYPETAVSATKTNGKEWTAIDCKLLF